MGTLGGGSAQLRSGTLAPASSGEAYSFTHRQTVVASSHPRYYTGAVDERLDPRDVAQAHERLASGEDFAQVMTWLWSRRVTPVVETAPNPHETPLWAREGYIR